MFDISFSPFRGVEDTLKKHTVCSFIYSCFSLDSTQDTVFRGVSMPSSSHPLHAEEVVERILAVLLDEGRVQVVEPGPCRVEPRVLRRHVADPPFLHDYFLSFEAEYAPRSSESAVRTSAEFQPHSEMGCRVCRSSERRVMNQWV